MIVPKHKHGGKLSSELRTFERKKVYGKAND
jgi:hypothetical protein